MRRQYLNHLLDFLNPLPLVRNLADLGLDELFSFVHCDILLSCVPSFVLLHVWLGRLIKLFLSIIFRFFFCKRRGLEDGHRGTELDCRAGKFWPTQTGSGVTAAFDEWPSGDRGLAVESIAKEAAADRRWAAEEDIVAKKVCLGLKFTVGVEACQVEPFPAARSKFKTLN